MLKEGPREGGRQFAEQRAGHSERAAREARNDACAFKCRLLRKKRDNSDLMSFFGGYSVFRVLQSAHCRQNYQPVAWFEANVFGRKELRFFGRSPLEQNS